MKKFLVMLTCSLLLVGCATATRLEVVPIPLPRPTIEQVHIVDYDVAEKLLIAKFTLPSSKVVSADTRYSTVSEAWITNKFAPAFNQFKKDLNVEVYKPDSNDCDDFASLARVFIRALYSQNHTNSSVLFGEIAYKPDSGGKHVTNFFVNEDRKVIFFSPQGSRIEQLSETEIKSIFEVVF